MYIVLVWHSRWSSASHKIGTFMKLEDAKKAAARHPEFADIVPVVMDAELIDWDAHE